MKKSNFTFRNVLQIKIINIFIALLIVNLSLTPKCKSDWVRIVNGMSNVTSIYSFATIGNCIFAGSGENYPYQGIYLSTNYGALWTQVNNGLTLNNVYSMANSGNNIFASIQSIYLSTNNGANWSMVFNTATTYAVGTNGNIVMAGGQYGAYRSTNNGTNWITVNNGFPTVNPLVNSFAFKNNFIFAGTDTMGVFLTTNNGDNWAQVNNGLINRHVNTVFVYGNNILAGTQDGVFLSTNDGTSWVAVNNGLTNTFILSFTIYQNYIFVGTNQGVFLTTNSGTTWANQTGGINTPFIQALAVQGGYVFAGVPSLGVYRRLLSEMIGIEPISKEVPENFSLSQNYPNPFNPSTTFKFQIPKLSIAKVTVNFIFYRDEL